MASESHNKFPTCYISPPLFQQWPYLKGGPGVTGFSCPGISTKVLVIGGGLSGLSCAWHVAEHGTMVKLLESERSLCGAGGRAQLHRLTAGSRSEEDLLEALPLMKKLKVELSESPSPVEVLKALTMVPSNVEIFTNCQVTRLLYSADGQCCGCVFSQNQQEMQLQGKVILCNGGILSSLDSASLLAESRPDLLHWPLPLGLGFGGRLVHHVAQRAKLIDLQRIRIYATGEAQGARRMRRLLPRCLRGLLMCSDGKVQQKQRTEEEIAIDILRRGPCWLIRSDFHPLAPRGSLRRVLVRELAEEMQVPMRSLLEECADECEPGSTQTPEELHLWVAQVTPVLLCCEGGLEVEGDSGAVLSRDGKLIGGLFAAGEAAASSESSLSSCVSSALRAATAAVKLSRAPAVLEDSSSWTPPARFTEAVSPRDVPTPAGLRPRLALSRVESFLKTHVNVSTLQKALLRSVQDGRFESATEDFISELKKSWGLLDCNEALSLELRDPVSGPRTCPMFAALPEAGVRTTEVSSACVHCRLPLKFKVSAELANGHRHTGDDSDQPEGAKGFAYATLLYGSGVEYFLGALVLGWALKKHGCEEDRLLLYTEDVPDAFLDALQVYWTLKQVDYLQGDRSLFYDIQKSRFQAVFTKIQVLSCTEYAKVLMMDLDILVRGNLDELFQLRAPASLKRCSGKEQPEHGGDYMAEDFFSFSRRVDKSNWAGGMNAGVMLLEPNKKIYERMCQEIQDPWHPEHYGSYTPEQDYLGRFYGTFGRGAWTHLHAKFNYQPNLPDNYVGSAHRSIEVPRDVIVAHYSGPMVKPWKIQNLTLNVTGVRRLLEDDGLEDHMGPAKRAWDSAPRFKEMDGVQVAVQPRDHELPSNVRQLMWEWVLALRECDQELLEDGIDLLFLISISS